MAFDEVQFPTDVSRGATARPRRVVDVVALRSGYEERNTIWANSRRTYNVALGMRDMSDIYDVIEFWEARRGRLRGFRFKDWADYRSLGPTDAVAPTDQSIGTGDNSTTNFQLVKTYSAASNPYTRTITKPVDSTVRIAVDSVELTTGWSVDTTTGIVTFNDAGGFSLDFIADEYSVGSIPASGTNVTAGFEFDVPVRFETEELEVNVALFDVGAAPDVNIVEVRV